MNQRRENLLALNRVTGDANPKLARNHGNTNQAIGKILGLPGSETLPRILWACCGPCGSGIWVRSLSSVPGPEEWQKARLKS